MRYLQTTQSSTESNIIGYTTMPKEELSGYFNNEIKKYHISTVATYTSFNSQKIFIRALA